MKLDALIEELIRIRAARPQLGDTHVEIQAGIGAPLLAYVSGVNADGDGPVDAEGPETVRVALCAAI